MSLIPYVEMHGRQVFRQPFTAKGVQFYGFILPVDQNKLQTLICDPYLNHPANGQTDFRAAGPFAMLVFNRLDSLSSTDPPDSNLGWFSEQEAAIWVLTVDRKRERLLWFLPYIFVDNSYAMAMGRELYGFPKSLGQFNIPDNPASADLLSLDTLVLTEFNPQTKGTWERLFKAERVKKGSGGAPKVWTGFKELMQEIVKLLEMEHSFIRDLRLLYDSADDLLHGRLPMVFLKQFPNVTNPGYACYQSIVEVPSQMTHFNQGCFLDGEYEVTINNYASHPVADDLGLPSNKLAPVASFWVDFEFEIGNGAEVWRAA